MFQDVAVKIYSNNLYFYRKLQFSDNEEMENETLKLSCYVTDIPFLDYTTSSRLNWMIIAYIYIITGIFGITLNTMFLLAFIFNKRLHKFSNYLLVVLSVIDWFVACLVMPGASVILIGRTQMTLFCTFHSIITIVGHCLGSMSFLVILCITLEQYIAILFPYYYKHHTNIKLISIILLILFTSLIIWCVVAWFHDGLWIIYETFLACFIILSYLLVLYCWCRIFLVARKQNKRISLRRKHFNKDWSQKNKAVKTSLSVTVTFTLCYLPMGLVSLYRFSFGRSIFVRTYLFEWVHLICTINTVANPIVYYWRLPSIRNTIRRIFLLRNSREDIKRRRTVQTIMSVDSVNCMQRSEVAVESCSAK